MTAKIIVDAGVLVSAYGANSGLGKRWRESLERYEIVISPEIFIEAESRLRNGEFNLSSGEIKSALKDIVERCDIIRPSASADPKSDDDSIAHLVALAKHRFADGASPSFLVTDSDRLCRESEIDGCKILRIEDFCNSLRQLQTT